MQLQQFALGAVEDDVLCLAAETVPRLRQGKLVFFAQSVKVHPGNAVAPDVVPAVGADSAVQNGFAAVRHDDGRVGFQLVAETGAGGAGAEGVVEGEHPGGQLLHGDAAVLTGVVLGEGEILLLPQKVDDHQSAGELGSGLHAVRQPLADVGPDDEPVHDDLDGVLFVLFQLDLLVQLVETSVHSGPDIAGALGVLKHLGVFALFAPDHRSHHLDPGPLRQRQHLIDDLVNGLLADLPAAVGAVRRTRSGPQQTEIVVDLRHGAHGGPGVLAGGFLVDGNGGAETLDIVHIRLVHLPQKHPGVGGEAFHIPPLSLGINGVEGQRGLAAAGHAGDHHQLVPRDGDVNIFQIVGPCAFDNDVFLHGVLFCSCFL